MKFVAIFLIHFQLLAVAKLTQISGRIDPECPQWTAERFYNTNEFIYFGVRGATDYGFTYEFPISREGVDYIWCVIMPSKGITDKSCPGHLFADKLRPFAKFEKSKPFESDLSVSFVNREEQMNSYLTYVQKTLNEDEIKYPNVGKVLELLARFYLQELTHIYPRANYTISSGVEYKHVGHPTLGELDIIVYNRKTCEVVALGESKASSQGSQSSSLRSAMKQIKRFQDFIYSL